MSMSASSPASLTLVERFLRLFTDIRPGEGRVALLMFVNVFLILWAYYLIKPLREGWIMVSAIAGMEQMEVKAYTSFAQTLLLVAVIAGYSRLVTRWPRGKLITRVTLFCMSNLVLFWFLQPNFFFRNLPWMGIAFFLWVGMFGVFVVAQFWAFAADIYTDDEGRRLIPMVAIGATAGAAFGSQLTKFLVEGDLADLLARIGFEPLAALVRQYLVTESLLLVALVPLGVSILLTHSVDRMRGSPGPPPAAEKDSLLGGVSLVFATRFLLGVAIVTVLVNWVNTNGENLLTRVVDEDLVKRAAAAGLIGKEELLKFRRDETTAFYADFYGWVNYSALILQAFVASRLLKYGGFGAILLLLPVVALISYTTLTVVSMLVVAQMLPVVRAMKIAENSTDYSINNTARSVLWLPVSSELKFKGKPAIDTVFARVGDGMAALTVLIGARAMGLSTSLLFAINIPLVLIWIVYSLIVVREHRALTEQVSEDAA